MCAFDGMRCGIRCVRECAEINEVNLAWMSIIILDSTKVLELLKTYKLRNRIAVAWIGAGDIFLDIYVLPPKGASVLGKNRDSYCLGKGWFPDIDFVDH